MARTRPAAPVYPVFLTGLDAALCIVVGGGQVAARKVRGLLAAQAPVRVISPELNAELANLHTAGRIAWETRPYTPGDLLGARLVFAATNVRAVNRAVAQEARAQGILCNVVDAPAEGSFHVPAVYRTDQANHAAHDETNDKAYEELVIAVGTGGKSPGRAVQIRDRIAAWLGGSR